MYKKVFDILKCSNQIISGTAIAKELGISRTAVWKAINKLRDKGVDIQSMPKGYRLVSNKDIITESDILKYTNPTNYLIEVRDIVTSTNDCLREEFLQDGLFNKALIAREQTRGRGRQGKVFESPSDCGLYISFLLEPLYKIEKSILVTTMAAVAVAEAINEVCGITSNIKWVNDVYIEDKKVAGILTESSMSLENGELEYIILGIGINTRASDKLSREVQGIATDLSKSCEVVDLKSKLAGKIITKITDYYKNITDEHIFDYYNKLLYLKNENILYKFNKDTLWEEGKIIGIDKKFRLLLETDKGIKKISYGEIFIKK